MNSAAVERIVNAVLYEGYILYPYRPSFKNHRRWTFGNVFPRDYCARNDHTERSAVHIECLVEGGERASVTVEPRFLQVVDRRFARSFTSSVRPANVPDGEHWDFVDRIVVDGTTHYEWQEAIERRIPPISATLGGLVKARRRILFHYLSRSVSELTTSAVGEPVAVTLRQRQTVTGWIDFSAESIASGAYRLKLDWVNTSPSGNEADEPSRETAQRSSLASTHVVLEVDDGAFASLTDPPAALAEAASACRNDGAWPVLLGNAGDRSAMLASPIILPDHPQTAEETAGDFFDGTEIDEMLALRIQTLTDDEKRTMTAVDDRVRALLERSERCDARRSANLPGAIRSMRPLAETTDDERVAVGK